MAPSVHELIAAARTAASNAQDAIDAAKATAARIAAARTPPPAAPSVEAPSPAAPAAGSS